MNERRFHLPSRPWRIAAYVALIATMLGINYWAAHRVTQETRVRIPYSPFFLEQVRADNVTTVTSTGSELQGTFERETKPPGTSTTSTQFVTEIPAFANTNQLSQLLQDHHVTVNATPLDNGGPLWERLLLGFGPTIVLLLLLVFIFRRMSGSRAAGALGRSKARRYQPGRETVTFADVAGIDEAKQELTEIVDFLRDPEKYRALGGRIPRGVLLSGPPGTGKTLLARAVAGEAGAPFFSMSASEFVEAIVGVGASRVRDLFRQAKQDSPSIVFIDELDAVGRAALQRRRLRRRQRRARADAEPDPDRDGRLRHVDGRDRGRRDEPDRRARQGAPAARPLRPACRRAGAGPGGAAPDSRGAHARRPACCRRRPRADRRHDARHGRGRPGEFGERGGAARRSARARGGRLAPTSRSRSRRSSSAPSARS